MKLAPATFNTYYEPFLGGASYFLALAPRRAVLADANEELVELYRVIGADPGNVMDRLDAMQPYVLDRERYYEVRATSPRTLSSADRAARFIFLNKTGFNGLYRVNQRGDFNVSFGRYEQPPRLYERDNFLKAAALFRRARIECADFEGVLDRAGNGDFVYLDPPYVPTSTTANFTKYTAGSFGEADHRRLADAVHGAVARGCSVLLSNSDTPLVHDLYSRYRMTTLYASRNINSDTTKRQKIAEIAVQALSSQPRERVSERCQVEDRLPLAMELL